MSIKDWGYNIKMKFGLRLFWWVNLVMVMFLVRNIMYKSNQVVSKLWALQGDNISKSPLKIISVQSKLHYTKESGKMLSDIQVMINY
jgi:hypothetical protein